MKENISGRNLKRIKIGEDESKQSFKAFVLPMTIKKERIFALAVNDIRNSPENLLEFVEQFVVKQIVWWDLYVNGKRLSINIYNLKNHVSVKQQKELIDSILPKTKAQRKRHAYDISNLLLHLFETNNIVDCFDCKNGIEIEGGKTIPRTSSPNCNDCVFKSVNIDPFRIRNVLTTLHFNIWPRTGGLENQEPEFLEEVLIAKDFIEKGIQYATK